jgi:hypothetical protein
MRALAAGAALALAVVIAAGGVAGAATNNSWEVLPAGGSRVYFVYTVQPGRQVEDSVVVRNLTGAPRSLRLYAADAVNTPGNGAFGLLDQSSSQSGIAGWVTLSRSAIVVPPRATVTIPFRMDVPLDARAGDQAGGIVAAETTPDGSIAGTRGNVAVVRAVGARIYVRVAGQISARLTVARLSVAQHVAAVPPLTGANAATVTYTVRNTGNIRQAPTATLTVTDELGRTVARAPVAQLPDLLPGGSATTQQRIGHLPVAGRLTVHLQVRTTAAAASAGTGLWTVAPADVAIVVLVVAGALILRRRHRRPVGTHSPGHTAADAGAGPPAATVEASPPIAVAEPDGDEAPGAAQPEAADAPAPAAEPEPEPVMHEAPSAEPESVGDDPPAAEPEPVEAEAAEAEADDAPGATPPPERNGSSGDVGELPAWSGTDLGRVWSRGPGPRSD